MTRSSSQSNQSATTEMQADCLYEDSPIDGREDALHTLAVACESNSSTLLKLLQQVSEIHDAINADSQNADSHPGELLDGDRQDAPGDTQEIESLRDRVIDLESHIQQLERQNEDLASRVASQNVESSVAASTAGSNEALSWEERKQLMLQQMEDDSFNAESFIESIGQDDDDQTLDPIKYVTQLQDELDRRSQELDDRRRQVQELQHLLDQQSETRDGGIAIGAAAITEMFDTDDLVREERERLQHMQEEWEEKFRQAEIEASLERAKLSRERQEVARKLADLEEELAHAKRESRANNPDDDDKTSRRWLTKLGLADGSE